MDLFAAAGENNVLFSELDLFNAVAKCSGPTWSTRSKSNN